MTKTALRLWILVSCLLPTLIISLLLGGYFNYLRHHELESSLSEYATNIGVPLAISSAELLAEQNLPALERMLRVSHRLNSSRVVNISLYNEQRELLLTSNPQKILPEYRLDSSVDLPDEGMTRQIKDDLLRYQPLPQPVRYATDTEKFVSGFLLIHLNDSSATLMQKVNLLYSILFILICLTGCILFSLFVTKKLDSLMAKIKRHLGELIEGKFPQQQLSTSICEFSDLQKNLNILSDKLAHAEQELQHSVEQATGDLQQSMELLEVQNIQLDFNRRKAQEENRQKTVFLAKMSHELRTPLNGVIGFTRQLMKTPLNPSQRDYLHTIQKSANSLLHLVNDVLDFSQLEEGRLSVNQEPFSLRDLLDDTIELLAPQAFDKQLELVLMVDPGCPDDLITDPARLTQVLVNIIGNAIKFTDHGSIIVRISANQLNEGQLILHCSVQDTGNGISEEEQSLLFQGFRDTKHKKKHEGSGLGLMISQRLVQAMGGNIGFESKLAEGSTFWFTIKCKRHHLSVIEPVPVDILQNKHILYYEPQQLSREATCQLLSSWGSQITVCVSAEQLKLALSHNQHYDIGLLGRAVAINQLNSVLKLIQQVKAHCDFTYLLVNTLSPTLREAMLTSGADACLPKPTHHRKLAIILTKPYLKEQEQQQTWEPVLQNNLRILTVDDNSANLKLINTLLQGVSTQIDSASDGAEAWHKTTHHVYDIIFMDVNMPVMDGIEACQRIRQNSLNELTPIIAVTAHALEGERERLMALGFSEFLTKPLDEHMLYFCIQEFCLDFRQKQPRPNQELPENTVILPQSALLDWDIALQRAGGKADLAKDMLKMLLSSLPQTRQAIQSAIQASDAEQLLHHIHKLNGASCYTGIPRLKQLSELLETQLKQNTTVASLEPELFELDDLFEALLSQSKGWTDW